MSLTELPLYFVSQFEEFGRLLVQPALDFFSHGYSDMAYLLFVGGLACLGVVTTVGLTKIFVEKVLQIRKKAERKQEPRSFAELLNVYGFALLFAILLVFGLSVVALLLGSALTEESLLFIVAIAVMFPPAGLFLGVLAFAVIGIVSPFFWLGMLAKRCFSKRAVLIQKVTVIVFLICALAALLAVITESSWDDGGGRAHHLHAIVKNTCLIDPERVNCPQTVEDMRVVEPRFYDDLQETHQIFYRYNPENNEYVLVVRYSPHDAVLFSQLLKSPEQNGNQANDFQLLEIETFGRDRVKEMPDFAREFEYLPEWDKR